MKAAELLDGCALPRLEARALLAHVLNVAREHLIAHPDARVPATAAAAFAALAAQRRGGVPLAYLLGRKEFYGREFRVTPAVLVPRPDTETLVDAALACLGTLSAPRVLDLGTGSGCIAVTLKLERPDAQLVATDLSAAALDAARGNANALGADIDFRLGDWYRALPTGAAFDLIVANPPYVAKGDPHLAELSHEPGLALTDGGNGLHCLTAIIAGAPSHLGEDAWLVVEHGYDQADAVAGLMRAAGLRSIEAHRDGGGQLRVTRGRRPR